MHHTIFELPSCRALVRRAGPHLLEGTIAPLALFYGSMQLLGIWGALGVALAWSYGAIAWRLATRRKIPGLLLLGVATLTARTVVSLASGSVFLYFLQPTIGTVLVAGLFLVSVPAGRPLAAKLAEDFFPMPAHLVGHAGIHRFFRRISLLWAFVGLANAGVSLWLLTNESLTAYLFAKPVLSFGLTAAAIAGSVLWFKHSMSRHGISVRRAPRAAMPAVGAGAAV